MCICIVNEMYWEKYLMETSFFCYFSIYKFWDEKFPQFSQKTAFFKFDDAARIFTNKISSKWLNKRNSSYSMTISLPPAPFFCMRIYIHHPYVKDRQQFRPFYYKSMVYSSTKSWVIFPSRDNWILKNDSCAFFLLISFLSPLSLLIKQYLDIWLFFHTKKFHFLKSW